MTALEYLNHIASNYDAMAIWSDNNGDAEWAAVYRKNAEAVRESIVDARRYGRDESSPTSTTLYAPVAIRWWNR